MSTLPEPNCTKTTPEGALRREHHFKKQRVRQRRYREAHRLPHRTPQRTEDEKIAWRRQQQAANKKSERRRRSLDRKRRCQGLGQTENALVIAAAADMTSVRMPAIGVRSLVCASVYSQIAISCLHTGSICRRGTNTASYGVGSPRSHRAGLLAGTR